MIEPPEHRSKTTRLIAERLMAAKSLAVATHVNGDGDGWGSACALAHHLGPAGIDVWFLAATPYPDRLRVILPSWVEPCGPDVRGLDALRAADVQLVVDASEPSRLGEFAEHFDAARTVIIDHHAIANSRIEADISLIDPAAAATAELVYEILGHTGIEIGADSALALYVGLVTDTGSFRYSNTTPRVHRMAADLIERGVDPEALYQHLFGNVTATELAVLEAALSGMRSDPETGLVWSALGTETAALEEYELIIDHLRNLDGTQVAVLLRDLGDGTIKISLRSNGPVDVATVAQQFDGGGHIKAAGANIDGSLAAVTASVVEACRRVMTATPA